MVRPSSTDPANAFDDDDAHDPRRTAHVLAVHAEVEAISPPGAAGSCST